jgi:hypothetical protein
MGTFEVFMDFLRDGFLRLNLTKHTTMLEESDPTIIIVLVRTLLGPRDIL